MFLMSDRHVAPHRPKPCAAASIMMKWAWPSTEVPSRSKVGEPEQPWRMPFGSILPVTARLARSACASYRSSNFFHDTMLYIAYANISAVSLS